jgi:hypothetical protein
MAQLWRKAERLAERLEQWGMGMVRSLDEEMAWW